MDKNNRSPWKDKLTPEQYHVCCEGGTEPPFSGQYYNNLISGVYACICCQQRLFDTKHQFNAGCGWPSFTQPVCLSALKEYEDLRHGMVRTEVRCSQCDAHLGHVFSDGPLPGGLRYCINSVALSFTEHATNLDKSLDK